MIKNVIFDFGNVICLFDKDYILEGFSDDPDDRRLLKEAVYYDWTSLDKGVVAYEEYIKEAMHRLPIRLHGPAMRVFRDWYTRMPYIREVADWIPALKEQGYSLYLLSNAPAYFSRIRSHFEILNLFDGIVVSGDIRLYKPEDRIYRYILDEYRLVPEECLFIDDRAPNVEGARRCGLQSAVYHGNIGEIAGMLREA